MNSSFTEKARQNIEYLIFGVLGVFILIWENLSTKLKMYANKKTKQELEQEIDSLLNARVEQEQEGENDGKICGLFVVFMIIL